jgi:hypothetical protein
MPDEPWLERGRNLWLLIGALVAAPFVLGFLFVIAAFLWPSGR